MGQMGHMIEIEDLPEECINAMLRVYNGGYVFDVHEANLLTFVELNHPEFIIIGGVPEDFPLKRKPIYSAVLTQSGREFIDELYRDQSRDDG